MDGTDFLSAHYDPVVHYATSDAGVGVRRVNPAFEETFYADEAPETVSLGDTVVTGDVIDDIAAAIDTGDRLDRDVRCATADGERTFRLRNVPSGDGGYLVYTDVNDRAERIADLEERNQHLETFASVISHDLRNPIDVARRSIENAREDDDSSHLDRIEAALDQMKTLIDDVLALAREGKAIDETERTNLAGVAERAWDGVDAPEATLSIADENATLQADPARLRQAFENLFRNTTEHAGVTPAVTVGTIGDGDGTGFYLEDDGPGIPPDERDEVFEPGVTSSTDGTGLGLAIVERVAAAHGWEIAVTDAESGGARFEVTAVDSLQPF
jgi:signal transduction histidine kinase